MSMHDSLQEIAALAEVLIRNTDLDRDSLISNLVRIQVVAENLMRVQAVNDYELRMKSALLIQFIEAFSGQK